MISLIMLLLIFTATVVWTIFRNQIKIMNHLGIIPTHGEEEDKEEEQNESHTW
jgi:hypothetical protein